MKFLALVEPPEPCGGGLRRRAGRRPGRAGGLWPALLQPPARARARHRRREEAGDPGAADREGPWDAARRRARRRGRRPPL